MKKVISIILLLIIFLSVYFFRDDITNFVLDLIYPREIITQDINDYKINYKFKYIEETDDFYIKNEQHFLNILYTILNNGWNDFTFYCDKKYLTCQKDINSLIHEKQLISHINNFVAPYNSYENISIIIGERGKITLLLLKKYSARDILSINQKVDSIYSYLIKDNMNNSTKIRTIHDYIIKNTVYRENVNDQDKASGALLYNQAVCSGYTDAMALFLNKMNIPNYRISSDDHVWNLVYLNNKWQHIDLTWDDPVTNTGANVLTHDYYLIDTNELLKLDKESHNFDFTIYKEASNQ